MPKIGLLNAIEPKKRAALLGLAVGVAVAAAAHLASAVEWVFLYVLSAPWYLVSLGLGAAGTSSWLLLLATCCYFGALGATVGAIWALQTPRRLRLAILSALAVAHLGLAITGDRKMFAAFFDVVRTHGLIGPDIWPKQVPSPAVQPGR